MALSSSPLVYLKHCIQSSQHSTMTSQKLLTECSILSSSSGRSRRRRTITIATVSSIMLLSKQAILTPEIGHCLDLRMTVPDQSLEEAEEGLGTHVRDLVNVKELIELESWRETQKALRKSSSLLKQDIYTIIQAKPGSERSLLRKLNSELFNSVTKLDYAARNQDSALVQECYGKIIVALDSMLSRL
ncbi:psbQ-like protein 3, chloroplastic [Papaver somniferum]|nr:psbQ-like protein 3, chloroplastic [Papaver somniferum]